MKNLYKVLKERKKQEEMEGGRKKETEDFQ